MPVGAGVALVGAYSANEQRKAGKDAARSAERSGQQAIDAQNQAIANYGQLVSPYTQLGSEAASGLGRLAAGDYSGFQFSPEYQFANEKGTQELLRGAASRGALNSGGTDADLIRFGQGLASQQLGNYTSRLTGLAQLGAGAAQGLGQAGTGTASNVGQIQTGIGQARGEAGINAANATSNLVGGLAGLAGQYYGQGGFGGGGRSSFGSNSIGPVTRQVELPKATYQLGGY